MWTTAKTKSLEAGGLRGPVIYTVSAIWMSAYLFDSDSPNVSWWICVCLHAAAWTTVFCTWRQYQKVHGGRPGVYCAALLALVVSGGPLRYELDLCAPPARVVAYSALHAAVRAQNLAAVNASLARFPVPDQSHEPESVLCGHDEWCQIADDPLLLAVKENNIPIAAMLLKHGAVAAPKDCEFDYDPFIQAARQGDIGMMRLLLVHGATVCDADGDSTPLWYAARYGRVDAVRFLLHLGASPNTTGPDYSGGYQNILCMTQTFGYRAISDILRKAGAKR